MKPRKFSLALLLLLLLLKLASSGWIGCGGWLVNYGYCTRTLRSTSCVVRRRALNEIYGPQDLAYPVDWCLSCRSCWAQLGGHATRNTESGPDIGTHRTRGKKWAEKSSTDVSVVIYSLAVNNPGCSFRPRDSSETFVLIPPHCIHLT